MELSNYLEWCVTTRNPSIDTKAMPKYLRCGGLGEIGELLNKFKKCHWHNKYTPPDVFVDEIGDVVWYTCNLWRENTAHNPIAECKEYCKFISPMNTQDLTVDDNMVALANDFLMLYDSVIRCYKATYMAQMVLARIIRIMEQLNLPIDLSGLLQYNYDKLTKRHGDKFNEHFYTQASSS